jgi:CDP-diacylglycerol--glycerol-3-phosphate 3-phosphatidyltransferase
MKALPNILSAGRLVLTLFMFLALILAGDGFPGLDVDAPLREGLERFAFIAFVIAAVTDYFDGWLARKLDAVSVWGAILDPIGDKVLVCGAVLGLLALGPQPWVVLPAGFILFREFTVSALREVGAGRGVKLPVTQLAKWKTTIQLIALAGELLVAGWPAFGLPQAAQGPTAVVAHALFWLAALITVVTGVQYWNQTRKALAD